MNRSGIMEAAILDYYVFTGEHSRKKRFCSNDNLQIL